MFLLGIETIFKSQALSIRQMKRKRAKQGASETRETKTRRVFPRARARNVVPLCAQLHKRFALSIWVTKK